MAGFELYHRVIDFVDNPGYDFLSYNINPNLIINCDGFRRTIEDEYNLQCITFVKGEWSKEEKRSLRLFIRENFIVLSAFLAAHILFGFAMTIFANVVFDDKFLWFAIFWLAFLIPLLLGIYKLLSRIIRSTKYFKHLEYQNFVLTSRMMSEKRNAASCEISDAVAELTRFFENNYYLFDGGKQIRNFFRRRNNLTSLEKYSYFKEQSVKSLIYKRSVSTITEIVVELILGVLGTILNIIKDYSIIAPVIKQITFLLIASILLVVSAAYLLYSLEAFKLKSVYYYYYLYSYLFLESTTNKSVKTTYVFDFSIAEENGSKHFFENFVYNTIQKENILAFKKDTVISQTNNGIILTIYGVREKSATLMAATKFSTFDDFFRWGQNI